MTVHLMAEAQNDRTVVGANSLRIGTQVAVIVPASDGRQADGRWVNLHQGHSALVGRGGGKAGTEWLEPSAVVEEYARLDPDGCRERFYSRI